LIIDDEIDLCLLLKSYFVRQDYEVYLSHSLADGLEMIRKENPAIIFLDNNLPDGTGWAHAPQIANLHPDIKINLISAFHPAIPEMPEGVQFYVYEKPVTLADLDKQFSTLPRPLEEDSPNGVSKPAGKN